MKRPVRPRASVMPAVVTLFILAGFFGTLGRVLWAVTEPALLTRLLEGLVGALVISLATAVGYWLGSSAGSRERDAARREPPPGPAPEQEAQP